MKASTIILIIGIFLFLNSVAEYARLSSMETFTPIHDTVYGKPPSSIYRWSYIRITTYIDTTKN